MRLCCLTLIIVGIFCLTTGAALAAGGIYFDDFSVTNDGTSVFSDNFDDGNVSDWGSMNDAALSSAQYRSSSKSLYLNFKGNTVADAFHRLSISNAGIVEASSWVWLPAVQEQYSATFTNMVLYSSNTNDNMFAGITLHNGESGYRVNLGWNGSPGASVTTNSAVLAPQTWAKLTLRLNPTNSTVYALLNDQEQVSFAYTAANFSSIYYVSAWGWLGDRQPVPEPSGLLSLLCGATAVVGFIRRRSVR